MSEQIEQQELIEAAAPRFLDYAVSVIKQRALPDVRDGMKPVHRRILYTMYDMGMTHKSVTKKCAKIVGNALGSFHPHGDMALYEALIRLGQPFVNRIRYVDIQGNCGSLDDPKSFAAQRYTEARPTWTSDILCSDLQYNACKMIPNFDNTTVEPEVLPSPFPNILCSSNIGIAVGFKTDVYPYNFNEMIEGAIAILTTDKEDKDIFGKIVKGPDFPTGGKIVNGAKMFKYFINQRFRCSLALCVSLSIQ
jgi:DNA gyrase/topoisomerase IV subunit A